MAHEGINAMKLGDDFVRGGRCHIIMQKIVHNDRIGIQQHIEMYTCVYSVYMCVCVCNGINSMRSNL